ncbi:MAG: CcmD family protein [Chloroflexi bacterium]|nr:CcmD family protein [Chloroflexota bacterium]
MNPNTNLGYLFAIYIITWAGFFAYMFLVSRRQRDLEREIRQLRQLVEQKTKPAGNP